MSNCHRTNEHVNHHGMFLFFSFVSGTGPLQPALLRQSWTIYSASELPLGTASNVLFSVHSPKHLQFVNVHAKTVLV